MEVCPQFNRQTNFVGAATIAQARLFNMDPAGSVLKQERLRALAGDGGIQECGFAQNCVEACPSSSHSPSPSPSQAAKPSSSSSKTSSPADSPPSWVPHS